MRRGKIGFRAPTPTTGEKERTFRVKFVIAYSLISPLFLFCYTSVTFLLPSSLPAVCVSVCEQEHRTSGFVVSFFTKSFSGRAEIDCFLILFPAFICLRVSHVDTFLLMLLLGSCAPAYWNNDAFAGNNKKRI
jgi:hypothetical protein